MVPINSELSIQYKNNFKKISKIFHHTMYLHHDRSQRQVGQQNGCCQSIQNYRFSIKTILKKFRKFFTIPCTCITIRVNGRSDHWLIHTKRSDKVLECARSPPLYALTNQREGARCAYQREVGGVLLLFPNAWLETRKNR